MINSAQKQLDAILALLRENREVSPAVSNRFRGTDRDDVFFGQTGEIIASGRAGNDALVSRLGTSRLTGDKGNDLLLSGNQQDTLVGNNGNDILFAGGGDDRLDGGTNADFLDGGTGNDTLLGGGGNDQLVGSDGIDTLTGGLGNDQFIYSGNLFANGTPALVAAPGIRVLNQPDIITDYTNGQDQMVFDTKDFGNASLVFQRGNAAQIADGNAIVLLDAFATAGAAARAIANNANVQADEGVFVYFNSTLGVNRVVYSKDLSDGGNISVLANLDSQRGPAGLAALANFTAADFALA